MGLRESPGSQCLPSLEMGKTSLERSLGECFGRYWRRSKYMKVSQLFVFLVEPRIMLRSVLDRSAACQSSNPGGSPRGQSSKIELSMLDNVNAAS